MLPDGSGLSSGTYCTRSVVTRSRPIFFLFSLAQQQWKSQSRFIFARAFPDASAAKVPGELDRHRHVI